MEIEKGVRILWIVAAEEDREAATAHDQGARQQLHQGAEATTTMKRIAPGMEIVANEAQKGKRLCLGMWWPPEELESIQGRLRGEPTPMTGAEPRGKLIDRKDCDKSEKKRGRNGARRRKISDEGARVGNEMRKDVCGV